MVGEATEDQSEAIHWLGDPASHGDPPEGVRRIETHANVVFLAGDEAIKIKRAVVFPFLDYGTLQRRARMCRREIEVNHEMAPMLYRGAAPLRRTADGGLYLDREGDGGGEVVEWTVLMHRFREGTLLEAVQAGRPLAPHFWEDLGAAVAAAHGRAPSRPAHGGRRGLRDVAEELGSSMATAPDLFEPAALKAVRAGWGAALERHGALLDRRQAAGAVRQCHGDLHLANICLWRGAPVPFDAIEFDDAIACTDMLYDLAFLLMDMVERGLDTEANHVLNAYLERCDDLEATLEGMAALPLMLSIRAGIRARVGLAMMLGATDPARAEALGAEARTYLDVARRLLEPGPPRLIAVGGVQGTGKSTLARRLAPRIGPPPGAVHLRSDVIRKRLRGVALDQPLPKSAYTAAVSKRVFETLERLSALALRAGQSVVADAVFAQPAHRQGVVRAARESTAPFAGLWLSAPLPVLERRVTQRRAAARRDVSDAGVEVMRRTFAVDADMRDWDRVDASGSSDETEAAALRVLGPLS